LDKSEIALAGPGGTKISNLKDGDVSATSKEAVNGSQLHATNVKVDKNTADINVANQNIQSNTSNIATNTTNITELQAADKNNVKYNLDKSEIALAGQGGTKISNLKDGAVSATSKDAVNGSQLHATNVKVDQNTADINVANQNIQSNTSNIATNTTNIATNTTNITELQAADKNNVKYNPDKSEIALAGQGGTKISNLKDGVVSATSKDAVNGSQLHATNVKVDKNTTDINVANQNIQSNTSNIATNTTNINELQAADKNNVKYNPDKSEIALAGQGGTKISNLKDGVVSATSKDAVNGSQLHATNVKVDQNTADINVANQNIQSNTSNIATNTTNIATNTTNITELQAADKNNVKYNPDKSEIALAGTGGTKISNLKDGDVSATSKDAVNGSQLHATNVKVDQNTADINVANQNIQSNTSNIATNTTNIATNTTNITELQAADKNNVKYNPDKSEIALAGPSGTKISNLKDGDVSATSKDAVNGSQLHATNVKVDQNTADINVANQNIAGNTTNINELQAADKNNVKYNPDKSEIALAGTGGTKISNLKDGVVSATSKDAVNGSQLHATNVKVDQNTADINVANQNIAGNTTNINELQAADKNNVKYNPDKSEIALAGTGGTKISNLKDGDVSATSKDAVNGSQLHATNVKVDQNTADINIANQNIATNTTNITELQAADKNNVKYNLDKSEIALAGQGGTKISNLKDGDVSATSKDAVNGSQLHATQQMIKDVGESDANSVKYNSNKTEVVLAGSGGTKISNLKDGDVSATSKDAVNGGQLHATSVKVDQNTADINVANQNIQSNTSNIATNTTNITELQAADKNNVKYNLDKSEIALAGQGGTKISNLKDGVVSATSKDAVNGSQLHATNVKVDQNTADINVANQNIAGNTTNINELQAADKNNVKYNPDKSEIALAGTGGTKISNLKDGVVSATSKEAVNGSQLHATNVKVDKNTADINVANQNIQSNTSNIATNTTNITELQAADKNNVKYNLDKSEIALAGQGGTKISNLKDGDVSATSKDAVNGSQLHTTNVKVDQNTADINVANQNIQSNTSNIATNTTNITELQAADKNNVKYNLDKSEIALAGQGGTKISNLKDGDVSATSKDAVNGSQLHATQQMIKNVGESDANSVKYNSDKTEVVLAGSQGTKISNLKNGDVSATSKDAVNGSQLHATNVKVDQNALEIKTNSTNINTNALNINTHTQQITKLQELDKDNVKYNPDKSEIALAGQGGTKISNLKDGVVSATSKDAVNGSQLHATNVKVDQNTADINVANQNIQSNTSNIATNTTNITELQAADKNNVKYNPDKSEIALAGTGGTKISNLKDGDVSATSKDAINGSQLHATNVKVDQNTADINVANQNIQSNTSNIATNTTNITELQAADKNNVKYNPDKSEIALAGTGGTKISNLKDGDVSATSKDAVNGSQLHATQQMIKNVGESDANSVKYNSDKTEVVLAGAGGTKISNLKDGDISATSKDAVNGSQLHATNVKVDQNTADINVANQNIQSNTSNIATNTTNIATNTTNITDLQAADKNNVKYNLDKSEIALAGTGGTKISNLKDGVVSSTSKDAVNGSQLHATQQMIKEVGESDANSVKYDGVMKDKVSFAGAEGTLLTNVKNGTISAKSSDAINGSQLYSSNLAFVNALGGNAQLNPNGTISMPNFVLNNVGGSYNNVGSALNALDNAIGKVNNVANSGWTLKGTDSNGNSTSTVVKPGSEVGINGSSNITVTQTTDKNGNTSVDISLDKDIKVDSVTAKEVNTDKVSVGGVTIDKNGINAGGKQISGVGNATSDDQAVNLGQAKEMIGQSVTEATAGAVQYDKDKDGNIDKNSVSFGGSAAVIAKDEKTGVNKVTSGGTTLNNVANGTEANHAVNKGQLDSNTSNIVNILGGGAGYNPETQEFTKPSYKVDGNDYHDVGSAVDALDKANQVQNGKIDNLERAFYETNERLETVRKDVNAGISAAMAMGNLPQPNEAGSGMVSAGIASYQGQSAVAVGVSATSESNKVIWKFAGTADSRNNVGGAISMGYQWK
ncbi:TPA: YadA-like family protein, partial [Acinetobacter baumannii]|nr:YadA-like family protein [Acinetobacter baumannii]